MPKVSEDYKEKRRLEILETALQVFIENGFSATTMTDIVNATGLSRGGLYHYFSNTDELYRAILVENDRSVEEYFRSLIENSQTAWDCIETFLSETKESILNTDQPSIAPVNLEYFIIGRHEEGRSQFIQQRIQRGVEQFSSLLKVGVDSGEYAPIQKLDSIAMFIINFTDAIHIQSLVMERESNQQAFDDQFEGIKIYLRQVLGIS